MASTSAATSSTARSQLPAANTPHRNIERRHHHAGLATAHGERLNQSVWSPANASSSASAYRRCLSHLVAHLESQIAPIELKEAIPEDDEFDELSICNAMAELGYQAQRLALAPKDVDPRLLPCLFIPDGDTTRPSVIVALEHGPSGLVYTVLDGLTGVTEQREAGAAFEEKSGTVFFFKKRVQTESAAEKQYRADTNLTWFGTVFSRFTPIVWQLIAISVILNIVALATPLFVMVVYDRVISTRTTDTLPMLLMGAGLALALELWLRMQRSHITSWLAARVHYIVGTEVFKRLFEIPPALLQQASLTAQISRIRSFESVRDFFSGPIFASTLEAPSAVISVIALLFFSIKLALVPLGALLAITALFFVLRHYVSTAIKLAATEASITQRFIAEALQEREDIRANGLVETWKTKFRELSGRENHAYARLHMLAMLGEQLSYAISILTGLVALAIGVGLVWSGEISTGMLVASMILIWRAVSPFANACAQVARFEQFGNSTRQINLLMDVETEDEVRNVTTRLPALSGQLELQNVAVRYARESGLVVSGLNIRIAPGEVIGICGAMGTGKSTILKLIQCMVEPQIGKVKLDQINIQQLDARMLRRQIGYVPQISQTYPGTIAENVRMVRPDATDAEIWRALERVRLASIVRDLPRGLQQPITSSRHDNDFLLRMAFARLYLQDPRIVLIDDIKSNTINNGVDGLLSGFIGEARDNRTVIFVSQRLDLLRMADRVIALQHGKAPLVGSVDTVLEATS